MGEFIEMDELKRLETEIDDARKEISHLLFLQSSGQDVTEMIEEIRKKLVELRTKVALAQNRMGVENDDRHKTNTRK